MNCQGMVGTDGHEEGVTIPRLSLWAVRRMMVSLIETEIQERAQGWGSVWKVRLERGDPEFGFSWGEFKVMVNSKEKMFLKVIMKWNWSSG